MYEPGFIYQRTPEESRDMFLAWDRSDKAFFAAGACHILAHTFLSLHYEEDYQLIYIKPKNDEHTGNHLYASNGIWAFDFNGWTLEEELLEVTEAAYKQAWPDWDYERIVIAEGLPAYIAGGQHNLRPPEYFPELPWRRAYAYLQQFPPNHP
ncbi:MAG TPA: hypothetical protein VD735_04250 [Candidatus Saccharimonadales bacterium]|nr:hypothetical protein [Candidatus Saccharimonadales bacterium]